MFVPSKIIQTSKHRGEKKNCKKLQLLRPPSPKESKGCIKLDGAIKKIPSLCMPHIQCNPYWEIRHSFFLGGQVKYLDQHSWLKFKTHNLSFSVCPPPYWLLLQNCHLEHSLKAPLPSLPMKSQNMQKLSPGSVSADFILSCKIQQTLDFRKTKILKWGIFQNSSVHTGLCRL